VSAGTDRDDHDSLQSVTIEVVRACCAILLEPVWVEFDALLTEQRGGPLPKFRPGHPLGCHRRRIPDRVVFEHLLDALVHGSGYERITTERCSDRTLRRRLKDWAELGIAQQVHAVALSAYDRIIGLDLQDVSADRCITKAPSGGDKAGPSPVDRRKQGLKRSTATEADGVPLGLVSTGANRHDSPLLRPTLDAAVTQVTTMPEQVTVHLDAAYDNAPCRQVLAEFGFHPEISRKGMPAPIQVGQRWVVERTNSWLNGYGKQRRCTDRDGKIVDFYLYLAAALLTVRRLIQRARSCYRWDNRPTVRRLK
jgi:transposase